MSTFARVKLARVDNRLLHATVAVNWSSFINVNYFIVVDPTHVNDPFIEKVMQLCLPKSMIVKIFDVPQMLEFLNEEKNMKINVMLIFKDLDTVLDAVEQGLELKEIQLPYPASRVMMKQLSDHFDQKEIESIRKLQDYGIKLYFQTAPMDAKEYGVFNRK